MTGTPADHTEAAIAAAWHHERYLTGGQNDDGTYSFTFSPFTGREQRPSIPASIYRALATGDRSHADSTALARINAEVSAAKIAWNAAHLKHRLRAALGPATTLFTEWRRARDEALTAYEDLFVTDNHRWRAALLHLVVLRENAAAAATRFDEATLSVMLVLEEAHREHDQQPSGTLAAIAEHLHRHHQEHGVDFMAEHRRFEPSPRHRTYFYPQTEKFRDLIRKQDEAIRTAADLASPSPTVPD